MTQLTDVTGELTDAIKKKRSPLALAILEDESVRQQSETRSKEYMDKVDEHDISTPFWMWCALWYVLGMLTVITIDLSVTDNLVALSEWIANMMGGRIM